MNQDLEKIYTLIPQRPPFLFVDRIIEQTSNTIHTQRLVRANEEFFTGHFPEKPIMPGVLLQEACFQSGACLMASGEQKGLGVVTRVDGVKFRGMVLPGDLLDIKIELTETLANASYFKGKIEVAGKTILVLNFACALV
jgi:3-hydroxyacyl-[acyl-carrier-protein] dehydratase